MTLARRFLAGFAVMWMLACPVGFVAFLHGGAKLVAASAFVVVLAAVLVAASLPKAQHAGVKVP